MRFNGLKSHLRLQKLRFLDAPGLFLLEIVLTGGYDLADVLANVLVLKWMIGALMGRDLIRAAWVLGGFLVYQLSVSFCGTGILNGFIRSGRNVWNTN